MAGVLDFNRKKGKDVKRIDERDTMFARMSYEKGSMEYEDYYRRNLEKKDVDDDLRSMPKLCSEGTSTYDEKIAPFVGSGFKILGQIRHLAEGIESDRRVEVGAKEMSERIKNLLRSLGAKDVRISSMNEEYYYSHRGRHPENYGEDVEEGYRYAIVYSVEMDEDMINRAPNFEEVIAVTKAYMDASIIGLWGSEYIRDLGYPARGHVDGNYLVCAPVIGEVAGLGELGRHGLLVTEGEGSRVRLGVITTDLELIPDEKREFGLKELCEECGICSENCIGGAIPRVKSGDRWQVEQEACYRMWRRVGTDCGVCLSSCPLSQEVGRRYRGRLKDRDARRELLEEHRKVYGKRNYIKKPLNIMK